MPTSPSPVISFVSFDGARKFSPLTTLLPVFCSNSIRALFHHLSSSFRPFSVRQYFCSRLVGLSGMVCAIKPSVSISQIRSFSFPDTDLWPSTIASSDFDRTPINNSWITLSKIDSSPDSGPEETTTVSRPRMFEGFSPNSFSQHLAPFKD